MKLAWLTDIHLNFLSPSSLEAFLGVLAGTEADAFVISGDTGESHDLSRYLTAIGEAVRRPVYFVLGNHDFYQGSIREEPSVSNPLSIRDCSQCCREGQSRRKDP